MRDFEKGENNYMSLEMKLKKLSEDPELKIDDKEMKQLQRVLSNAKFIEKDETEIAMIKKNNREKIINEPVIRKTLEKLAKE